MKHEVQERIHAETRGMSPAQTLEYFRKSAEAFRRSMMPSEHSSFTALFQALEMEQEGRANK